MSKKEPKPGDAYYAGAKRVLRNGVPCRVAAWVSGLTQNGRNVMLRGTYNPPINALALTMRHAQTKYKRKDQDQ